MRDIPGSGSKMSFAQPSRSSSLGIRAQLLLGFGLLTLIFLTTVIATFYIVVDSKEFSTQVVKVILPSYDILLDLNNDIYQNQVLLQRYLLSGDEKYKIESQSGWQSIAKSVEKINGIEKNWSNESYGKAWRELKLAIDQLKELEDKIFNIPVAEKTTAINLLLSSYIPLVTRAIALLNVSNSSDQVASGLLDIQSQDLHQGTNNILNDLNILQIMECVLFIICIFGSIVSALYTSRSILKNITIFREHSSRVASGDLTQYITIERNDEIGQLGNDLNRMTDNLAGVTKQITDSCHNMVSALEEARHSIEVQSTGSAEQAASINQITASLSEIEKSSNQTMDKAQTLGDLAERTRERGQTGLEAVEQSILGMKAVKDKVQVIAQTILDLSNQTQQVGEITAVVNNLAQQSKMLALNASIEAAKAGDAGKGFAVVAVEVKNLAEQSEQSTAQVQKILEDIRHATEKAVMVTEEGTKGVDHGTGLVEQTGDIIRNLNDVIHETTIASQQIQAAIRQEGAGIEQIAAGMNEINQVTSTFVESARQTNEAINNLADIAKSLKNHIDSYKI